MKTYSQLYPQICAFENIFKAYRDARKGKRKFASVADFEFSQEEELVRLHDELQTQTWQPGPYHSFYIHDPKKRLISAAPFRDRVAHHALCNVIEPIWETRFIYDTYANRVGKGTHAALDRCTQYARRFKYVLQCDLKQYFPSIDHALLRAELARWIQDDQGMDMCDRILASGVGVLKEEYAMEWFAGDDLFAAARPRGLPIGNLTSQFWANVYLNRFDHFVKRELKCAGYVRYVDDFLLFGDDKKEMRRWRAQVIAWLAQLRLKLHETSAQVSPVTQGIPFLGFRVYPTHRRLKRRNALHFRARFKEKIAQVARGEMEVARLNDSVRSWINHARYGDTWGLRRKLISYERIPHFFQNV